MNGKLLNSKLVREAYFFADMKHSGQKRKFTTEDYIIHPVRVFFIVDEMMQNEVLSAAAILHDTIEDTDATPFELQVNFGQPVANLVLELSINPILKRLQGKRSYLVEAINNMSDDALFIKLADRLDNVLDLSKESIGEKFREYYIKETKHVFFDRMERQFLNQLHKNLLERLNIAIMLLEQI